MNFTAVYTNTASQSRRSERDSHIFSIAFWALLVVYCAWVFWLPEFPTQDGPVHLYYTRVMAHLFSGSPLFSQFFAVRWPPPPYAIHYFLLLFLTSFLPAAAAEKVIVCLAIILLATGFRYLATAIGPTGKQMSLWVLPLTLNWMLGMGFHNYLLSLGLSLWAMGLWLRAVERRAVRLWVMYLVLAAVMLVTHPVPLLMLLGIVACDIAVRALNKFRSSAGQQSWTAAFTGLKPDLLFFLASCLLASYILLFVDRSKTSNNLQNSFLSPRMLLDFVRLRPLGLTTGNNISRLYRLMFYPLLLIAILTGLRGFGSRWKEARLAPRDLFVALSIAFAVVFPLLPRSINGSDFFSDRLVIYIWILALAAASARVGNLLIRPWSAALAVCLAVFALVLSDHFVRPVAKALVADERMAGPAPGERGVFLSPTVDFDPTLDRGVMLSYDPFVWSAARYFRRTNTIMLNAPWLDLPILPVAPRGDMFANLFPRTNDYPDKFYDKLTKSEDVRRRVEQLAQFVVLIKYPGYKRFESTMPSWIKQLHCGPGEYFSLCTVTDSQAWFPSK